jgi:hypothetical protein
MTPRQFAIHYARAMLTEARRRRNQAFHATLLQWAANSRREAAALREPQAEMFA